MSKGNPQVIVRVPAELLALIRADIARLNHNTKEAPTDLAGYFRRAVRALLKERARQRRRGGHYSRSGAGQAADQVGGSKGRGEGV